MTKTLQKHRTEINSGVGYDETIVFDFLFYYYCDRGGEGK